MTRVVIHAGFHKTGTTTVQSTINANRRLLSRQVRCYLKPDFEKLTRMARAFAATPDEDGLVAVRRAAGKFFASVDDSDPRPVLMSSEDLSGTLPGRHGEHGYDAAPLILAQLSEAAGDRFGAALDLVFHFSTREAGRWLRSTWWQNLRATRLTLGFADYAAQMAAAADLDAAARDVARAVAPATVSCLPLEEAAAMPQGPITPLLDLVDLHAITRTKLRPLPPENVQPELDLQDVFLALNRSGLRDDAVSEAKKHLRKLGNSQMETEALSPER